MRTHNARRLTHSRLPAASSNTKPKRKRPCSNCGNAQATNASATTAQPTTQA